MDSFRSSIIQRSFIAVCLAALAAVSAIAQTGTPGDGAASQPAASERRDPPIVTPPNPDLVKPADPTRATPTTPGASTAETGWFRVTGNSVNVRSRADVNSIPVTRVTRDTLVQAVGREFGWYAIKPPADSFSYVAARYRDETQGRDVKLIERQGSEGVVRVEDGTTLRVRAGSRVVNVNPQDSDVQTKLKSGDRVRIIGERDEDWLMIAPPEGVKVYISAEFLQPVGASEAASLGAGTTPGVVTSPTIPAVALRPAAGWAAGLKDLEAKIDSENKKSITDQNWQPLLAELKPITEQREEPVIAGSAVRLLDIVQDRIRTQETQKTGSGLTRKEGTELASSVDASPPPVVITPSATTTTQPATTDAATNASTATPPSNTTITTPAITTPAITTPAVITPAVPQREGFDAEGELQATFAVPAGKDGLRYRLIDPTTRATRAYVEFPWGMGFKATENLGRYVGIQGERTVDMQKEVSIWRVSKATVLTPDRPVMRPRTNP